MLSGPLDPNKDYLGFPCGFCGVYLAFVEDPSKGAVKLVGERPLITLTCQTCGRSANYVFAQMVSFRGGKRASNPRDN